MSTVMCKCRSCGVQIGVKTGLSGGAHFVNFVLTLLTGFVWAIIWIGAALMCSTTRCTKCGKTSNKL